MRILSALTIALALAVLVAPVSPRPAAAQSEVTFAIVGDFGVNAATEQNVAAMIDSWAPQFVVTTGDDYYGGAGGTGQGRYDFAVGKYYCKYLKDAFSGTNCPTTSQTSTLNAFFPVLGNHDWSDAGPNTYQTYLDYFTLPGTGFTNSSGNERYYDFVQGPVHFFMVNADPHEPDGNDSASTQAQWLQARLAASSSVWNLVLFHHPAYSSGNVHGSTIYMQWPFAAWGADAVISGHDHTYERIGRDGIVYFVNGLGGNSPYGFGAPLAGSQARYNSNRGAQRVTASSDAITFQFLSIDNGGTVQDTRTLLAPGNPAPPGDCNGDLTVNAADLSGLVLEIFDGDGSTSGGAPNGSYAGDPNGCDANLDGAVDAGDVSCAANILFGQGSCAQ